MGHVSLAFRLPNLVVALILLLLTLLSPSVLSQTFTFTPLTAALPFAPRLPSSTLVLAPVSSTSLLFFGGSNGFMNNDVWLTTDSISWTLQAGKSETGNAPTPQDDASFPPTLFPLLGFDVSSGYAFQWGGITFENFPNIDYSTDTWYSSTGGLKWAKSTYAAGSPIPEARLGGAIVTFSNTPREPSFVLVGGVVGLNEEFNVSESVKVWMSSAVPDKPDVREWTVMGSTMDASGTAFTRVFAATLVDRQRLNGKDILYMMGGGNVQTEELSDAIWASSDQGATWVQLASSSFGGRYQHAAAVTTDGVLFVLGGAANDPLYNGNITSKPDMWASFDGGYTWALCTNTLPPRDGAAMVYNPYTKQLIYGKGQNTSASGDVTEMNDLYTADVSDAAAVASSCGTTLPSEGVGLTRWPLVAASSSSSSSSTGAASISSSPTSSPSSVAPIWPSSSTGSPVSPSSTSALPPTFSPTSSSTPLTAGSYSTSVSSSSSSSSSGSDSGGGGGGKSDDGSSSSSSTAVLTTFTILFAALTVVCAVLAYTQYRLRVYGTVCCEWCAGVSCGQLCGETVGWGTKWTRRGNLTDADLLRQVASDRYD